MKISLYSILLIGLFLISSCGDDAQECPECDLIPETGMCQAAFLKYYYDQDSMKCLPFTWGGCGGVVPFETLDSCESCDCE